MVKLRLTRTGKKHQPHYRIVAIDSQAKRDGRPLEFLGYYNPTTKTTTLTLEKEKIIAWLDKGAQPTDTMRDIFVKEGLMEKVELKFESKKVEEAKSDKKADAKPAEKKAEVKEAPKKEEAKVEEKPAKDEKPAEVKEEKPAEPKAKEENKEEAKK